MSHNDNRGNLTGYNEWTYAYDADNRLTSASKSGYSVQLYYDAEGRLTKVNRNGAWEYRYYDGPQCFFRSRADGTWIDLMIWGPTPDELNARWAPASGGWSFFHREPINSIDVATDIGGNVVERYLYDPFGKPEIRDANWNIRSSSIIANPYLFTGQEWMADLGLANYKNRFYSPALGRFLQNDPIRFDGGDLNLYRYCLNNPSNMTDSLGLFVDAVYDKSTGVLQVTDRDSGETVQIDAESGGKPFGDPIPDGKYDILNHPRDDFYRLESQDENYGDDRHDPTGRTEFRLHRPGLTIGCIAAKTKIAWTKVKNLINNTKKGNVEVRSKSRNPFASRTEPATKYGEIRVKDGNTKQESNPNPEPPKEDQKEEIPSSR